MELNPSAPRLRGFDEAEHPRDEHGRFSHGDGGKSSTKEDAKFPVPQDKLGPAFEVPEHYSEGWWAWTQGRFEVIREAQRTKDYENEEYKQFNLLLAANSDKIRYEGTAYRGAKLSTDDLSKLTKGAQVDWNSFMSTSKRIDIAADFAHAGSKAGEPVVFELAVKYKAYDISGVADDNEDDIIEREVVVNRSSWKVVSVAQGSVNGKKVTRVRMTQQ